MFNFHRRLEKIVQLWENYVGNYVVWNWNYVHTFHKTPLWFQISVQKFLRTSGQTVLSWARINLSTQSISTVTFTTKVSSLGLKFSESSQMKIPPSKTPLSNFWNKFRKFSSNIRAAQWDHNSPHRRTHLVMLGKRHRHQSQSELINLQFGSIRGLGETLEKENPLRNRYRRRNGPLRYLIDSR